MADTSPERGRLILTFPGEGRLMLACDLLAEEKFRKTRRTGESKVQAY